MFRTVKLGLPAKKYLKRIGVFLLSLCLTLTLSNCNANPTNQAGVGNTQASTNTEAIKLGFAKCAHCLPMALTPELAENVKIEAINFSSGNDVLTALTSRSLDVAQVTYLHFVTALDRGFDIVAISGQVNGGSEIIIRNDINLDPDDWQGLKQIIADYKKQGKPFRIAASRGNAQDIHMRGEFLLHGINPVKDIEFINIPNVADHAAALNRGEVEAVATVEPFASQIRLNGDGKHFALPYKQAAGNLTNLIVTRSDVIKQQPEAVEEVVRSVVKLTDKLAAAGGEQTWIETINKYTALDPKVGQAALKNAEPDYRIHLPATLAIAKMMKDVNYVQKDVSGKIESQIDYTFLSKVTGKPKEELGFIN